jgi:type I restriction enzyme, R subunit
MSGFTEQIVEDAALEWLGQLGYKHLYGPSISPTDTMPGTERDSYKDVILEHRLRAALERLNPGVPFDGLEEAFRKLSRIGDPSLILANRAFHRMLVNGIEVEYRTADGTIKGDTLRVLDFAHPFENDFVAVNQFTVIETQYNRRPDIVIFVNGLPVAVLELKNAGNEETDIWAAYQQLQTYKSNIPSLFVYNELLVISDGLEARLGSLTADKERFSPWRTIKGQDLAPNTMTQLQVMLEGVFQQERLLDLLRFFVVFEDEGGGKIIKKVAGYHQFHAARTAIDAVVQASSVGGDRRGGVVWHTQGSGKSLTMAFFAGKAILEPILENPTIVVLTDRNDLDDQLFGTFSRCVDLLRQTPVQAESRAKLRELLRVASGGVVFTTIQKFSPDDKIDTFPELSSRRNIIVIADEAHRSQYGLEGRLDDKTGNMVYGFAKHMRDGLPNATFIGFTGTPIESADISTRSVFGNDISVYDIARAVEDGATVKIYYESRLAKLSLEESEKPQIDPDFEEVTEGQEQSQVEAVKRQWAQLEKLVGTPKRIAQVAQDIVTHFEARLEAMDGKAMIVAMSRVIAAELYEELVKLRPEWHSTEDDKGALKVVITGSATDDSKLQPHIRSKARREALANSFKDASNPFKIVIVRDMWLTGFDAPSLHTMYIDKPMKGHGLMQAIARVNRVFKDKPGGLIVDYLGIGDQLQMAVSDYTRSGGKGEPRLDQAEAVAEMLRYLETCQGFFHNFDYSRFTTGSATERLNLIPNAQEHLLQQDTVPTDGEVALKVVKRFLDASLGLSKAYALSVAHEETSRVRDEVAFFQTVRAAISKITRPGPTKTENIDHAVKQIVSRAIAADTVIDLFSAAGLKRPEIGILSDEFLLEVQDLPQKNLAIETLKKLLNDEIRAKSKTNLMQSKKFSEMLEAAIRRYQNRSLETATILQELVDMAKEFRTVANRGSQLGLNDAELAFYDALEVDDSAVAVLGDDVLKTIARDLVKQVKENASIDWAKKESVRAKLRTLVKRTLRRYDYPPNKQEQATNTIIEQAELLAEGWEESLDL